MIIIVNTKIYHKSLRNLFYRNNLILLFDDKEARILHACLSLPSSPTHQLDDVSKVFTRDRGKEAAYVFLFRRRGETSLFHNKGRSFNVKELGTLMRAIISAF